MKTVQKSVLIWYSAEQMYDLVTDVAKYPEFLPWCDRTRVIDQDATGITAEVGLAFGGIRQSFTTRNTQIAGREVRLKLVSGLVILALGIVMLFKPEWLELAASAR